MYASLDDCVVIGLTLLFKSYNDHVNHTDYDLLKLRGNIKCSVPKFTQNGDKGVDIPIHLLMRAT